VDTDHLDFLTHVDRKLRALRNWVPSGALGAIAIRDQERLDKDREGGPPRWSDLGRLAVLESATPPPFPDFSDALDQPACLPTLLRCAEQAVRWRVVQACFQAASTGNIDPLLRDLLALPDNPRDTSYQRIALWNVLCEGLWMRVQRSLIGYLRTAVCRSAARSRERDETGGERWKVIDLAVDHGPGIHDAQPIEHLAVDVIDPETRMIRDQDVGAFLRTRPRPAALTLLLDLAPELLAGAILGTKPLRPEERRLLRILQQGIPPAEALRLLRYGDRVYINLLQKARRAAAKKYAAA
jgi:hypothetical protein